MDKTAGKIWIWMILAVILILVSQSVFGVYYELKQETYSNQGGRYTPLSEYWWEINFIGGNCYWCAVYNSPSIYPSCGSGTAGQTLSSGVSDGQIQKIFDLSGCAAWSNDRCSAYRDGCANFKILVWRIQDADSDDVTASAGDCNDNDAAIRPGLAEVCDGKDNDCDGMVDGITQACYTGPVGTQGVGICQAGTQTCTAGAWGGCAGDVTPEAEVCDGKDNNCNGQVDEGVQTTYYEDADGDGYGKDDVTTFACSVPSGFAELPGDCNDNDQLINPSEDELCDEFDNNCNGQNNEGFDKDNDGYISCEGDCNDNDPDVNPGTADPEWVKYIRESRGFPVRFRADLKEFNREDILTYQWDFGDGGSFSTESSDEAEDVIYTYSKAGEYEYSFRIIDRNLRADEEKGSIKVEGFDDCEPCGINTQCKSGYCNEHNFCSGAV